MCIISVPKYRSGLGSENVMREHSNGEDIEYLQIINTISECMGFPDSSVDKESTCNAGDPGLIPGSGRSAGEGIGYPLQSSWASPVAQLVKNPPDRKSVV